MMRTFGFALLLGLACVPAAAQTTDTCDDISSDREYHCEIREEILAAGNPLRVDASPNGGIRVRGWDRAEVQIRARVVTYADSEEEARRLSTQVRVETAGGDVRARGPEGASDGRFVVSFELNVPQEPISRSRPSTAAFPCAIYAAPSTSMP
jgi:hypothetical protein